jgi:hypothetical protein
VNLLSVAAPVVFAWFTVGVGPDAVPAAPPGQLLPIVLVLARADELHARRDEPAAL